MTSQTMINRIPYSARSEKMQSGKYYFHYSFFLLQIFHFSIFRYFKDELQGNTLEQFVGLRSKAYAMQIRTKHGQKVKIKCKGIAKSYRDRIEFEKYLSCITHTAKIKSQVRTIRARNHLLKIIHQNKTAVSSFDDKR